MSARWNRLNPFPTRPTQKNHQFLIRLPKVRVIDLVVVGLYNLEVPCILPRQLSRHRISIEYPLQSGLCTSRVDLPIFSWLRRRRLFPTPATASIPDNYFRFRFAEFCVSANRWNKNSSQLRFMGTGPFNHCRILV